MNDIPEEALRTIEESFGTRFVRHEDGEEEPDAEKPFASVFPGERRGGRVADQTRRPPPHTAARPGAQAPPSIRGGRRGLSRCVSMQMREIRLPENRKRTGWRSSRGSTWMVLEERLRERGGDRRSTPRARPDPPSAAGWPRTVLG